MRPFIEPIVRSYPVKSFEAAMFDELSKTPPSFRGFWFHTTNVKQEIQSGGWQPQAVTNSIYGAAIYLARTEWDSSHESLLVPCDNNQLDANATAALMKKSTIFACVLALREHEVQSCLSEKAGGCTSHDLIDWLNQNVPPDESKPKGLKRVSDKDESMKRLQFGTVSGRGVNTQNSRITKYFGSEGIKAIRFFEHGCEVVAVFDPSCIRVLTDNTDLSLLVQDSSSLSGGQE